MNKCIPVLVLAVLFSVFGCAKGKYDVPESWKNTNLESAQATVMAKVHERDAAYNAKDYDAIIAVYTDDAIIHNSEKGELKTYTLEEWKDRLPGLLRYWTMGDVTYATYKPSVKISSDTNALVTCKFVAEWMGGGKGAWDKKMFLRKVDGEWKIYSD